MKNKIIRLFGLGVGSVLSVMIANAPVFASGGCVPVYGGGVECPRPAEVLIDKKVQNPASNYYVDNLGPNDPKYRPQQIITFRIEIKNPSDAKLENVEIKDYFPAYVDYMSGPGKFDQSARVMTYTLSSLEPGQSEVYEVKGRIMHAAALPQANVICPTKDNFQPVNTVEAKADSMVDRDEAQFCIEKEMEVVQVPKAGPANWILTITGLISSFGLGLKLKKKI